MLIWMCAMHCEAAPLIEFYRLRKDTHPRGFDRYIGEDYCCIVSGVGSLNMAAATAWSAALQPPQKPLCWINLGIAGHRTLAVGSPVIANEISAPGQARIFHQKSAQQAPFACKPLTSHPIEQQQYPDDAMIDMEAYAFMHVATRFTDHKWCHSIKIVSDNQENAHHRDKHLISELIRQQITRIADFAHHLRQQQRDT